VRVTTVVVAHRSSMVAEGLAAGLSRYPEIFPRGTSTTAAQTELLAEGADVVVIDQYVPDAEPTVHRLRRRGLRVVVLGHAAEDDDALRVSPSSTIAALASAVVPQLLLRRRGPGSLTPREREVLVLVGRGLPGKQVARHLGISPKTVEHHKTRIFAKLGVANQAAAVRLAAEEGLGRDEAWMRASI